MPMILTRNGNPSICFVALDNFAALVDDPVYGHIGGAEIQQSIIGKELAKRGYRVSFVTLDHGQDETEIEGMRVIRAYAQDAGIRMLRFLYPRLTSLWHAMRKADADIYYQRTQDSVTGVVAAFCRWHHRKFIFASASNFDCMADFPYLPQKHARVLYRYGLRRANGVIAQTLTQQRLLRENFGVDSTVIPNCAPDYGWREGVSDAVAFNGRQRALWIGGLVPVKQLELLLDVAEELHDLEFDVVGDGNRESAYVQRLLSRAKSMPNIQLHGKIPHAEVHQFYRRAAVLVCTSHLEGFPNVFLEAWSHGLPVVSTVDLDNLIVDKEIGVIAQDVRGLTLGIRTLFDDHRLWEKVSEAARRYYLENHTIDAVMCRFETALREIMWAPGCNADKN